MLTLSVYSVLVANVYTMTAVVTGGTGPYTVTWTPNVPNRLPKTGLSITRSFSTTATAWSEVVRVTDATGAQATAVIYLDLSTDSPPPPPPPPSNPIVPVTAAIENALAAIPVGGTVDLDGPTYVITLTRV